MTIRVRCDGCSAVMKVKDELAGAKGKCPKCKTAFVVPAADAEAAKDNVPTASDTAEQGEVADAAQKQPAATSTATKKAQLDVAAQTDSAASVEAPVDLPLEATPPVPIMDSHEFDPMAALESGSSTSIPAVSAAPSVPVNKPSVADLMKEHNEKKGKRKGRQDKPKTSKATDLAQPAVTSGSAADALNRKYDQKRDESGTDGKVMTREERRQAEQKEAMIDFAKKGIPALAGVLLLSWGLITYMFSASLPPLGYASGKVTRNGVPMAGVQVVFAPKSGGEPLSNATVSQGFTDAEGTYTLMYNKDNEGVLPGNHEVTIMSSSGMTFTLPTEMKAQTVEVGESHSFDFNF